VPGYGFYSSGCPIRCGFPLSTDVVTYKRVHHKGRIMDSSPLIYGRACEKIADKVGRKADNEEIPKISRCYCCVSGGPRIADAGVYNDAKCRNLLSRRDKLIEDLVEIEIQIKDRKKSLK
jgi:hypothetical protein